MITKKDRVKISIPPKNVQIFLDFDGTLVEHKYPKIGKEIPLGVKVVKLLIAKGHTIWLNTMRADFQNDGGQRGKLDEAVEWITEKIGDNFEIMARKRIPILFRKPKVFVKNPTLFLDDQAQEIPMNGTMVDWKATGDLLAMWGMIDRDEWNQTKNPE